MKQARIYIMAAALVLMAAGSAFAQCSRVPLGTALDAMVSDAAVTVTQVPAVWPKNPQYQYYYEFMPAGTTPQAGFIIYPGGLVDVRAYAVVARALAEAGYLVALVPMPDCLVIFDIGRADAVIDNYPGITTWAMGGHSFAATGVCWYVYNKGGTFKNSSKINALVLWAGFPDASQPLTGKPVKVLCMWGTRDPGTTEEDINAAKPTMPPDTYYIPIEGANHSQFGWYGEDEDDYDFRGEGAGGLDNIADISRQMQTDVMFSYAASLLDSLSPDTPNVPAALQATAADDGSVWERVTAPGFGDRNNTDIVTLAPYQGNLYALTRNDATGFELWKTNPAQGWHRMHVQGLTDQNNYYGYLQHPDLPDNPLQFLPPLQYNPNMNIWADMIEFKGRLYVALSTGYMGSALFGSRGAAVWRTDAVEWEPVIGGHEPAARGTLRAIESCANNDGSSTAVFTDNGTPGWEADSLAGCVIEVEAEFTAATHGQADVIVPGRRLFRITSNTADSLTVQQQETAATVQSTRCDEYLKGGGDIGRPRNNMPAVRPGAHYTITCGGHARGFGDMWNKSIIDFEVFNNELYASIGLNTDKGARVMKTSDGLTWTADSPYSFDNFHGRDWHDGSDIEPCDKRKGEAVSSSATKMVKTGVSGQETLLIGGTGTNGCNGVGARVYRRDGASRWTPIVDVLVDENTTGSNENGFGYDDGGDFFRAAFQTWSWMEYRDALFVGLQKIEGGTMVYSTTSASEDDGAWTLSMGGADNPDPGDTTQNPALNGFGDVLNTGVFLYNYGDVIYAGTMVTNQSIYYTNPINGADLWKGTGPAGSVSWKRIVGDGFGDPTILQFQSFTEYADTLYMVAAPVNSSNLHGNEPENHTGVLVYRLRPGCSADSDCDDGAFCNGTETCVGSMCVPGEAPCHGDTPACDEAGDTCAECLVDGDCAPTETCRENVCMPSCELIVTHKPVLSEKLTKSRKVVLNITSQDDVFNVFGRIDLGPLTWKSVKFNQKKKRLRITAIVPAGLAPQVIPISVGDCSGEVVID